MKSIGPEHFLNRELSWLEFNQRVLDEALDARTPLLERLKFFCIASSNLDEFFEVRVAGLKQQIESAVVERSLDGLTSSETFRAVARRIQAMVRQHDACWREQLRPALAEQGFRFRPTAELNSVERAWVADYFRTQVGPVLTPLALDPAHPFPQLLNKSLNLFVQLDLAKGAKKLRHQAVVQVPRVLPRLVRLPGLEKCQDHLFLEDVIGFHLSELFPGTEIVGYWRFRVTRNGELYIDEEEVANLLKAVETELHNRRKGDAVRLEIDRDCPAAIRQSLMSTLRLGDEDVYAVEGPMNPTRLMSVYEGDHSPELRDPPFVAPVALSLRGRLNLFDAIRERDRLLHHPYETYDSVIQFLDQAAEDPNVLAIKQTLYRTGGDPRVIGALMRAAKLGKQVAAVVELRARFDEANNIQWARQLEEAGVHVLYGLVGYKIHAKVCLVVRNDADGIRRYVHFGTGNYNPTTARTYTDLSLFTCRPDLGEDATNFFNLLTGISQFKPMHRLIVAPFDLHERILALIRRETANAGQGLPARISAKLNALVDEQVIAALYEASEAGVEIRLIVRGICCLRPQLKGLSSRIMVRSIVDRFLEHSRVYYFENACQPEVFLSSADWMPRNFFRRVEVAVPILDGNLRERLVSEILAVPLADNVKARRLRSDGSYRPAPRAAGERPVRSQFEFIRIVTAEKQTTRRTAEQNPRYPAVRLAPRPAVLEKPKP